MKRRFSSPAFSLIELLIAIGVLAIVAALIIPKFLNVKSQAQDSVAKQMADQLNTTYANWRASGGTVNSTTPAIADILSMLKTPLGINTQIPAAPRPAALKDSGTSNQVRLDLPSDIDLTTATGSTSAVYGANFAIFFDGNTFTVVPMSRITSPNNWSLVYDSGSSPIVALVSSAPVGYGLTIYPNGTSKTSYSLYGNGFYRVDYNGLFNSGGVTYKIYQMNP
jgi:prepilin-type N-terminal cleavage/methylation domain-containing protein